MIKVIILSVAISVFLSSLITYFAMKIMSDFWTKFLSQTEERLDKKIGLKKISESIKVNAKN